MAREQQDKQQRPRLAAVRLERPGVQRCGRHEAGVVYRVPEDVSLEEAHRLVRVKGFTGREG